MDKTIKRYLIIILGWIFLILGVLGLFLPLLQGILFIIIGLYLLSRHQPWAGRWLERVKNKYPKLAKVLEEAKIKVKNWKGRIFKRKETDKQ